MQQSLKKIQTFIASPICIFQLEPLDYPTSWQQRLITSFFSMQKILQKSDNQIIRDLHLISESCLESIPQGFIYLMMLDKNMMDRLFQYLMLLRNDVWTLMAKNLEILLIQYGDIIKTPCLYNVMGIVHNLVSYNACTSPIFQILANMLSYYEASPQNLEFTRIVLTTFAQKFQQWIKNLSSPSINVICHHFLPKLIKISIFFHQQLCQNLIEQIWSQYAQICMQAHLSIVFILQSSPQYIRSGANQTIYNLLKSDQENANNDNLLRESIQLSLLPRKTQVLVNFILFQPNLTLNEMKYQLVWLQKSWEYKRYNEVQVLVDITKYLSMNNSYLQRRVLLLEWVFKKASGIQDLSSLRIKNALFYNFFTPQPKIETFSTPIILLNHFFTIGSHIFADLLGYALRARSSQEQRLRYIFKQSNKLMLINIDKVLGDRLVPESLQLSLKEILKQSKPTIDLKREEKPLSFDPESPIKQDDQQIPNYNQESIIHIEQAHNIELSNILLAQYFVGEFSDGEELKTVLEVPTYENFATFFKKLYTLTSQARSENNKQVMEILAQEGSKVIYLAFNDEFEGLEKLIQNPKSIICHMIGILLKQWHQVTNRLQSIKFIIKTIISLFPIAEVAFWYYFIMQFEQNKGNNRYLKDWLVPKNKADIVIKSIEAVLKKPNSALLRKAAKYSLK